MSYYESRIKALEEKVAEMAKRERMKAIPVEAQLLDSIAKLKADLHNCYTAIRVKDEENARLKAEVERLSKAGDELALSLAAFHLLHRGSIDTTTQPDIVAWNAAKEGKPSV